MEDDLIFLAKWKTTSIFWQKGRQPFFFGIMEDDLNFNENGNQHQIFIYWDMEDDLNFKEMEDNLNFKEIKDNHNFLVNERCPQCLFELKTTSVSF